MISLVPPRKFDFNKTVKTLQRGERDPVNIIHQDSWSKIFRLPDRLVLINTRNHKKILSEIIQGDLDKKTHKNLVSESLGLDDPILQGRVKEIPYQEKISNVIGLSVPGYPDLFEAIIQIIMGQQISVTVANIMRANFTNSLGGELIHDNNPYKHFPFPEVVLKQSTESLRSLGLSRTKSKSILHVAKAFYENHEIQSLNRENNNNDIRHLLTKLHGVGDWTVDWLLLRGFRRFEIIPNTDLAVRKAFT